MSDQPLTNMPESIRLYALAKATKFSHLPLAGGWYDQHPKLVQQWSEIMAAESKEEKRKEEAEQRKQGKKAPLMGGRRASRAKARRH